MNEKKNTEGNVGVGKGTETKSTNSSNNGRILSAVSYIIGFFAIIIYLIEKRDKEVRFHALQSTALSLAAFVIGIVASILIMIIGMLTGGIGSICLSIIMMLAVLAYIIYIIYLAYKAFKGERIEVPVIGAFVKKYI